MHLILKVDDVHLVNDEIWLHPMFAGRPDEPPVPYAALPAGCLPMPTGLVPRGEAKIRRPDGITIPAKFYLKYLHVSAQPPYQGWMTVMILRDVAMTTVKVGSEIWL